MGESFVETNKSLKEFTTFKVGGLAERFITLDYNNVFYAAKNFSDYFVLGGGSNLLVSDKGFKGTVFYTGGLNSVHFLKNTAVVGSGVKIASLINKSNELGLFGLEFLYGIPATVGGLIKMNGGAFLKQIGDYVLSVCAIRNGRVVNFSNKDCEFKYRSSAFNETDIILDVKFCFEEGLPKITKEDYIKRRRVLQPSGRTCGSVFKNGRDYNAGKIIDSLKLKGLRVGSAYVSDKHANFIISEGDSASDVYHLIKKIKEIVYINTGIDLKEEVIYLGDFT